MPRIPTVEIESQAGYPGSVSYPDVPAPTDIAVAQSASHLATQVGVMFAKQEAKIRAQKESFEVSQMGSTFDAALAGRKLDLQQEPDLDKRMQKFIKDADWMVADLEKKASHPRVAAAFRAHVARVLPREIVNWKAEILAVEKDRVVADATVWSDNLAREAAVADPGVRSAKIAEHRSKWEELISQGFVKATDGNKIISAFKKEVAVKQMDVLVRGDTESRALFREMHRAGEFADVDTDIIQKHYEIARIKDEQEANAATKAHNTLKAKIKDQWRAAANYGELEKRYGPELQLAAQGKHPFILADDAAQLLEANSKAPFAKLAQGDVVRAISVLRQEYRLGPSTQKRIERFRAQLDYFHQQGIVDDELTKFADELQTDERTMQGLDYQRINAGIQAAQDKYKRNPPALPPFPRLRSMMKNQVDTDLAEIRDRIRNGEDKDKVVGDVIGRHQKESDAIPQKEKDAYDFLDGRR